LRAIHHDQEILAQQEAEVGIDYTLFLVGSLILIATFVYAVLTEKNDYYEER
jgi:hypothetical protein